MGKPYSQLAVAVDIIASEYKTSNPIIISEMMMNDLGLEYTIHQISDYLDINKLEDYEKISNQINYKND